MKINWKLVASAESEISQAYLDRQSIAKHKTIVKFLISSKFCDFGLTDHSTTENSIGLIRRSSGWPALP